MITLGTHLDAEGVQVVYIPDHVQEQIKGMLKPGKTIEDFLQDVKNPLLLPEGVECGFITSHGKPLGEMPTFFVRYWRAGKIGSQLRTTANSERTEARHLFLYDSTAIADVRRELGVIALGF